MIDLLSRANAWLNGLEFGARCKRRERSGDSVGVLRTALVRSPGKLPPGLLPDAVQCTPPEPPDRSPRCTRDL